MGKLTTLGALASRWITRIWRRPPPAVFFRGVTADGRTVLINEATMKHLRSTAPAPSQASLNKVLAQVTHVRVLDWEEVGRGILQRTRVLAEFKDAESVTELRKCLRIVEDPATFGHCMCLGEEAIELRSGAESLATIGLHHGLSIRWDKWKHDAILKNPPRLLAFLAERGVPGPLERYERALREAEEAKRAAARWGNAMPSCLAPFWEGMMKQDWGFRTVRPSAAIPAPEARSRKPEAFRRLTSDMAAMRRALETSLPDPTQRALALFGWLGSGAGPWSGCPSYECVAERLLLEEGTEQLVAALARTSDALTASHLEGAARHFAGWEFAEKKPGEGRLLPRELRQRLLAHVLRSTDADKVDRARRAFAR
jgi:hypothetical protein